MKNLKIIKKSSLEANVSKRTITFSIMVISRTQALIDEKNSLTTNCQSDSDRFRILEIEKEIKEINDVLLISNCSTNIEPVELVGGIEDYETAHSMMIQLKNS